MLIGKIGKENGGLICSKRSPAVFVDPGAGIEILRRDISYLSVRCAANNDIASAFRRPHLDPIGIATIYRNISVPDRFRDDQI